MSTCGSHDEPHSVSCVAARHARQKYLILETIKQFFCEQAAPGPAELLGDRPTGNHASSVRRTPNRAQQRR
jgi:hypothetical protein